MVGKTRSTKKSEPIQAGLPIRNAIKIWQRELDCFLFDHSHWCVRKGKPLVRTVSDPTYDAVNDQITFTVESPSTKVTIDVRDHPFDPDLFLNGSCTCWISRKESLCEHTYAAGTRLLQLMNTLPMSPFVRSLFGDDLASWDNTLNQLDSILKSDAGIRTDDETVINSRLCWKLEFCVRGVSNPESIWIEPVIQTSKNTKRGGWTKGRTVSFHKILDDPELSLTNADYKIVSARLLHPRSNRADDDFTGLIFETLIGHPLVIFDSNPVTVRSGQLGLTVAEEGQSWKLLPGLDGRQLSEFLVVHRCQNTHVIAFDSDSCELIVARTSQRLSRLHSALEFNPPVVQPDSRHEFLKRVSSLEAQIPVAFPESHRGELVQSTNQLQLQIVPSAAKGARIEFRVLPIAGGAAFIPGDGAVEISGRYGDVRVRAKRDLQAEVSRAVQTSEDLFLNRFSQQGRFAWLVETDDDLMDLLDALRARPSDDPTVVWPDEAKSQRITMLGEVTPSSLKVEIKDHHDWFGMSGKIELNGQQFPLTALLAALSNGSRYVALGKGQFASISQAFRERLASVADMLHSNRGKLEFNMTAIPVISDLLDDQMTLKVSKKWNQTLARLNRSVDLNPQLPVTLTAELRDYQVEGFKWLCRLAEWGVGGILADDMGLGKTVQTLAVLLSRREAGPILVVAPVSVGFNWIRETQRFAPTLRPVLYRETDRDEFLKSLGAGDMLITSYYLMQQHAEELSTVKWGTLVLDEAQAIKNSQTKTAQVVRGLNADWRLALTGTPCENHLGDLWSIFRGVSPGLFGSWERFREVFADPIEKGKVTERKQALSRVLRPFVLRRTKSEVLKELPARTEVQLTAELSRDERRLYEDARLWAITHLTGLAANEGKDQRFQVLAALTKLRQLACHPRLVDQEWTRSSAKLDLFLETIDELREGNHRALVFSQFTSHLALIRDALNEKGISYQYLDGKTTATQRQQRVDAFQRGEGEFFLISLKAGGTGLNLTGADYVIHLDPWWNPAVEDQATDRAHRIGQTRPVTVYRLVSRDTIEEQILKLHGEKRNLVAGILDGTDQAAKLSTRELIDLIKSGGTTE